MANLVFVVLARTCKRTVMRGGGGGDDGDGDDGDDDDTSKIRARVRPS
jgi:hypothetical protein